MVFLFSLLIRFFFKDFRMDICKYRITQPFADFQLVGFSVKVLILRNELSGTIKVSAIPSLWHFSGKTLPLQMCCYLPLDSVHESLLREVRTKHYSWLFTCLIWLSRNVKSSIFPILFHNLITSLSLSSKLRVGCATKCLSSFILVKSPHWFFE